MTILLFVAIVTYGNLVLTGVVEEKSSRVVEVLLARMPARNLLAGKVAGIGLLGLAQFAVTALAALVAAMVVDSVDVPAVSGGVLAWVVVWFVLGYALYAMAYGALGSLASRTEDAQSVAGPVELRADRGLLGSLRRGRHRPRRAAGRRSSPSSRRPRRSPCPAASRWAPPPGGSRCSPSPSPLAAIAGLVVLGGRVYTGAILHTGATLKLRDAWHGPTRSALNEAPRPRRASWRRSRVDAGTDERPAWPATRPERWINAALIGFAVVLAAVLLTLTHDVFVGFLVGLAFYGITSRVEKTRHAHR